MGFGWCSTIGGQQVTRLAAAGRQLGGESCWEGSGWVLGRCSGRGGGGRTPRQLQPIWAQAARSWVWGNAGSGTTTALVAR